MGSETTIPALMFSFTYTPSPTKILYFRMRQGTGDVYPCLDVQPQIHTITNQDPGVEEESEDDSDSDIYIRMKYNMFAEMNDALILRCRRYRNTQRRPGERPEVLGKQLHALHGWRIINTDSMTIGSGSTEDEIVDKEDDLES